MSAALPSDAKVTRYCPALSETPVVPDSAILPVEWTTFASKLSAVPFAADCAAVLYSIAFSFVAVVPAGPCGPVAPVSP